MSYGLTAVLQSAIFARLVSDGAVNAACDGQIFDAIPEGTLPPLFVTLGEEIVSARADQSVMGAIHDFSVLIVSRQSGYLGAKIAAAAVSDALLSAPLSLARGRVVTLMFLRAKAERREDSRLIDVTFRALVDDT